MRLAMLSFIAGAMLAGCATTGTAQRTAESSGPDLDHAKMAKVEQVAFARGVKVIWINPPEAKRD